MENASELEGVAGSSTAVSKPGTEALGVQGAKVNRSIQTFADACVFLSNLCCLCVSDSFLLISLSVSQTLEHSFHRANPPQIHLTTHF